MEEKSFWLDFSLLFFGVVVFACSNASFEFISGYIIFKVCLWSCSIYTLINKLTFLRQELGISFNRMDLMQTVFIAAVKSRQRLHISTVLISKAVFIHVFKVTWHLFWRFAENPNLYKIFASACKIL